MKRGRATELLYEMLDRLQESHAGGQHNRQSRPHPGAATLKKFTDHSITISNRSSIAAHSARRPTLRYETAKFP